MLVVTLVLLVAAVPFLLLGEPFEAQLQRWLGGQAHRWEVALGVVALLGTDIVLPVPSSGVCTLAGARLGIFWATIAAWMGMTLSAVAGFALARWIGEPLLPRDAGSRDPNRLHALADDYGVLTLALTRPVPILAESAVLLLGATRLAWRSFLPVVVLSNLAIALVYATVGAIAFERGQLAIALAASIGLPVVAAWIARRWLSASRAPQPADEPR